MTDGRLSKRMAIEEVRLALEGGAAIVQYREKELPVEERIGVAKRLAVLCSGRAVFIVNDVSPEPMTDEMCENYIKTVDLWLKGSLLMSERAMLEASKEAIQIYLRTPSSRRRTAGKV